MVPPYYSAGGRDRRKLKNIPDSWTWVGPSLGTRTRLFLACALGIRRDELRGGSRGAPELCHASGTGGGAADAVPKISVYGPSRRGAFQRSRVRARPSPPTASLEIRRAPRARRPCRAASCESWRVAPRGLGTRFSNGRPRPGRVSQKKKKQGCLSLRSARSVREGARPGTRARSEEASPLADFVSKLRPYPRRS